jgi:hypothetical protein
VAWRTGVASERGAIAEAPRIVGIVLDVTVFRFSPAKLALLFASAVVMGVDLGLTFGGRESPQTAILVVVIGLLVSGFLLKGSRQP